MQKTLMFSRHFSRIVKSKTMAPLDLNNIPLNRPLRVSVEGNIGSGKSTLMNYFKRFSFIEAYSEPLDKWRDVQGHNLLGLLYDDLSKWNATFQSYVQLTRTQIQSSSAKEGIKVQMFERSVQNNRYCFMENSYKSGFLLPAQYSVLCKWYEWIQENIDISLDLIIYLKSSPEVVYQRVLARNRNEEKTITFKYLKALHEAHESWLSDPNLSTPVYVIDADAELAEIVNSYQNVLPVLVKDYNPNEQVLQG